MITARAWCRNHWLGAECRLKDEATGGEWTTGGPEEDMIVAWILCEPTQKGLSKFGAATWHQSYLGMVWCDTGRTS